MLLKIGQLARQTGLTVRTLHHLGAIFAGVGVVDARGGPARLPRHTYPAPPRNLSATRARPERPTPSAQDPSPAASSTH